MSSKQTLVIGAGLACAAALTDFGIPVTVLEASPHVGGLARSFELWGKRVDLGPHRFFSEDRVVIDFWRRFAGTDVHEVHRLTRIAFRGQLFHYPLRPSDVLTRLGPLELTRAMTSYARARLRPDPSPASFEAWVVNRFGRRLFELFFRSYTEKLWGIPCASIDADWAAQRIKSFSLSEAVKSALGGGARHAILVDRFAWPRGGSGVVYERMRDHVVAGGGTVLLSSPVERVLVEGGRVSGARLTSVEVVPAQNIVSSMPLTVLVQPLPDTPEDVLQACARLRFRSTILVYLHVATKALFPDHWIYLYAEDLRLGRVTNFRN